MKWLVNFVYKTINKKLKKTLNEINTVKSDLSKSDCYEYLDMINEFEQLLDQLYDVCYFDIECRDEVNDNIQAIRTKIRNVLYPN